MRAGHQFGRLRRRGKVIVLFALSLIGVIGAVAIAADGGMLLDNRRRVQTAADVAAMAAAGDLFLNYQKNSGADPSSTAADKAYAAAEAEGFPKNGTDSTVTVNIPPKSGDHVGESAYVEVIIDYKQPRYFSRIFGSTPLPLQGRAVAHGHGPVSRPASLCST